MRIRIIASSSSRNNLEDLNSTMIRDGSIKINTRVL